MIAIPEAAQSPQRSASASPPQLEEACYSKYSVILSLWFYIFWAEILKPVRFSIQTALLVSSQDLFLIKQSKETSVKVEVSKKNLAAVLSDNTGLMGSNWPSLLKKNTCSLHFHRSKNNFFFESEVSYTKKLKRGRVWVRVFVQF